MKEVISQTIILFFIFLFFFKSSVLWGQDIQVDSRFAHLSEEELININTGWQLGLGFGIYFAGKEPASYYNGSGKNNLRRQIKLYNYHYEQLREHFHHDFDLDTANLPQDMSYEPALTLLFSAKYNFNENNGIIIDFSYSRLTSRDVFALTIDDPGHTLSEPILEFGSIWGKEERVNINIGYFRTFGEPSRIKPFWEFGININDTKATENKAEIGPFNYDIRDRHETYYGVKEGGIGSGFFVTQGVLVNINKDFAMHLAANFSMKSIALQEDDAPLSKNWSVFFRLVYKNLFSSGA